MKDVEEGGDGVTGRLANLGLVDEGIIEQSGSILLLLAASVAPGILPIGLLLRRRHTGDVEAHLDELVLTSTGLLPLAPRAAQMAVGACVLGVDRQRHLDGDLIATRQVGVPDL